MTRRLVVVAAAGWTCKEHFSYLAELTMTNTSDTRQLNVTLSITDDLTDGLVLQSLQPMAAARSTLEPGQSVVLTMVAVPRYEGEYDPDKTFLWWPQGTITYAMGETWEFDEEGLLVAMADGQGQDVAVTWDENGRPAQAAA